MKIEQMIRKAKLIGCDADRSAGGTGYCGPTAMAALLNVIHFSPHTIVRVSERETPAAKGQARRGTKAGDRDAPCASVVMLISLCVPIINLMCAIFNPPLLRLLIDRWAAK
jgi:hypothetical protein